MECNQCKAPKPEGLGAPPFPISGTLRLTVFPRQLSLVMRFVLCNRNVNDGVPLLLILVTFGIS